MHVLWVLLLALFMAGCQGEPWRTKSIAGLMPPLDFELSGTRGKRTTEADVAGSAVLLTFGYTSCPDICPAGLARLVALKRRLPPEKADAVRILFVSVDPQRDTPDRIASFARHFGPVLGLTGSRDQLGRLARRYRTTFSYGEPDADGFYDVAHSSGVYVFDRKGDARLLFRVDDSIEAMEADLLRLLK